MKKLLFLTLYFVIMSSFKTFAQDELSIRVTPPSLSLEIGEKATLNAIVVDQNGREQPDRKVLFYAGRQSRKAITIDSTGQVTALKGGNYQVILISPDTSGKRIRQYYPVLVKDAPIAKVELLDVPEKIYAGTTSRIIIKVFDAAGFERTNVDLNIKTDNESVAKLDKYGNLTALKPGSTTLRVEVEGIEGSSSLKIVKNPAVKLELASDMDAARTGDVFHFKARLLDKNGKEVTDAPVKFAFHGESDNPEYTASGVIKQDGRFVADVPGLYTVIATSGANSAMKSVEISQRNVSRKIEVIGHGSVSDKHTSDFWIWQGKDGKDYGVTGTWGADGTAYFWDVTDPANIFKIDSVQVDARTVNDVKVSEDGNICIISREGASNRKNGIIIIDCKNPADVKIVSTFTENLTGGVHNLFIDKGYVYALSAGRKYYIIDIKDPANPFIVSDFELETPGHSIHDVWIEDGIAYSSNWADGIQLVDIGNGIAGGSPKNPVQFASYAYPSGANHASFPYNSSTGKFYVVGGDEKFPYGLDPEGDKPSRAAGFLHFIDFSELNKPEEVARFEIPMAGSHNYWIDGDILYAAFYNGGVRVVDISGELLGDLYKQGREIAWIIPEDPRGFVKNAPFTWGAQLHKGHIFYSDWNSGLWSAKLEPVKPKNTKLQSR
ncbi:MAG: hypothetical protein AAFQ94_11635 [Bacteroidota bacterium]